MTTWRTRTAALAAAFALVGAGSLATAPTPAQATGSELSIAWAGGNASAVQQYQPTRDPASVHYDDLKNLAVTVDQTDDLVDQTVTVSVTGMPGQTQVVKSTGGTTYEFGSNFIQAMQCWGDPSAADFYENCEWGAFEYETTSAPSVLVGEETGVGNANGRGTTYTKSYFSKPGERDVPFRAVSGTEYSTGATDSVSRDAPLLDVFNAGNTNERTIPVDKSGSATFEFETQTAAAQPYLGCGNPSSATGNNCWLVIVPRAEHNSTAREYCQTNLTDYPSAQQGGPVNPYCDYWGNRVVVPLHFRSVTDACSSGSDEIAVVGTELVSDAFSSWQKSLCRTKKEAFAFTNSADQLARDQLISGQAKAVFTARPLTTDYLSSTDADTLAKYTISYAPVAVASVGIAYVANYEGSTYTDLKLSPRLIAKLLTNSYAWDSGLGKTVGVGGAGMDASVDPGVYKLPASAWQSPVRTLRTDPEFVALNPGVTLGGPGSLILVGPNAADSIAQLWKYLQADDKARAFLSGQADNVLEGDEGNAGMTINPYYLPKGYAAAKVPTMVEQKLLTSLGTTMPTLVPARDANGAYEWTKVGLTDAAGAPLCLCDAAEDTLSQADQTLMPRLLDTVGQPRYDMSQVVPYAGTYAAAATRIFHVDSGSKTSWVANSNAVNGGSYASDGQQRWTEAFLNGFTTASAAARLALPLASLQVPNQAGVFVRPDAAGTAAAVAARTASAVADVTQVPDAGSLPSTAYPLTSIVYLAVNAADTDTQRRQYADLIDAAVSTTGQTTGSGIGQLPEGYSPLPDALREQAVKAAAALRVASTPSPSASSSATTSTPTTAPAAAPQASAPAARPVRQSDAPRPTPTPKPTTDTPAAGPPASVLGGALAASMVGLLAVPFLMHRRRIDGD